MTEQTENSICNLMHYSEGATQVAKNLTSVVSAELSKIYDKDGIVYEYNDSTSLYNIPPDEHWFCYNTNDIRMHIKRCPIDAAHKEVVSRVAYDSYKISTLVEDLTAAFYVEELKVINKLKVKASEHFHYSSDNEYQILILSQYGLNIIPAQNLSSLTPTEFVVHELIIPIVKVIPKDEQ